MCLLSELTGDLSHRCIHVAGMITYQVGVERYLPRLL